MALEDIFKGFKDGGVPGVAVGIGAVVLAPILIPVVAQFGKPLAKAAIKEGISLYEKSKEVLAEAQEVFEDIVAEAKTELAQEQKLAKSNQAEAHPETVRID